MQARTSANSRDEVRTFFLEGVRSGRLHGPFSFQTGSSIDLDTGTFRLDVLSASGSFILTEQRSGSVFGVYELVPGRIIDAGYQLFTISRVSAQSLPLDQRPPRLHTDIPDILSQHQAPDSSARGLHDAGYQVCIVAELANQIAYDWTLDNEDGGRARYVERRGVSFLFSRGILTLKAGWLSDGEWQETVRDPDGQFEQGTLSNGIGWLTALSLSVPVFTEGRWSVFTGGGIEYQRESFDLQYGAWETINISDTVVPEDSTNGVTNGVMDAPTTTIERFARQTQSATLSEMTVNLTARIDYTANNWFAFAGMKAVPWSDTDLKAFIDIDDRRVPISFERRHPFSSHAGIGFYYQDLRTYIEMEAGSVNAIRVGVNLSF